ncbi:protein YgfX [Rhodanobacter ginsengiterrae]|uniref:protein YgfX n=1 Tax=Rhodanobacter ginsengiterrae TaxID=2008451 RepID=UPI003CE8F55B
MTSAPAIGFEYRPSPLLRGVLVLVAALALLATLASMIAWWSKLLLAAAVLLATWMALRHLATGSVAAAGWSADQAWTLRLRNHEDVPATLGSFRVLGGFILLRLRTGEHGVQVLLLAPDNSDADTRRRLRMRLATIQPGEALPRL